MADMAGSNGIQPNDSVDDTTPNVDTTDYESMSGEERKIYDRRIAVDELLVYKSEKEVAKELGVGLRTIERDVDWLKKEIYKRKVDDLAENGFSYVLLKSKRRFEDKLRKMHRIELEYGETPHMTELEQLIPLWKIQNDTESLMDNIVGAGPTLQGLRKAVEKSASD